MRSEFDIYVAAEQSSFTELYATIKLTPFMKHLLSIILITLLSFGVAQAQNKVETIAIKASIYCDHCKQCESCGNRLENAVYGVKGIKRVDIDEAGKSLTVIYNPKKTSADAIRKAIAKVGYDADDVKADPAAYAKLDDCCKK